MVCFAVLEIVDDELDLSAPELAEDLEHRVDYPEHYDGEASARIPGRLGHRLARCRAADA